MTIHDQRQQRVLHLGQDLFMAPKRPNIRLPNERGERRSSGSRQRSRQEPLERQPTVICGAGQRGGGLQMRHDR